MDFIERWFHVSPDHGSGATEWLYVLAGIAIVLFVFARKPLAAFFSRWTSRRDRK
jgi:hypothetical protein